VDRLSVIRYGQDRWNADRIDAEITQVAEWARQRGVPVVCDEFGVYREYADPRDRAAWIHDVRTALERHNMGWTMWDYSGSFGVVTKAVATNSKKDGPATPDEVTLRALGLILSAGK
jgi:aryl-phospho-beta-D-glucosidase BglC (GH1 family)